jgi:hypothetical protein
MVRQRPVQIKFQPPGHAFEEGRSVGSRENSMRTSAAYALIWIARDAGLGALGGGAMEKGLSTFFSDHT